MSLTAEQKQFVRQRANFCCEYCRLGQDDRVFPFQIDHILSLKHGDSDDSDNLCLSCLKCNGYKGSNVAGLDPLNANPTRLFHPRQQVWTQHFQLNPDQTIHGITPEGRVTVYVLRMNDPERVQHRQTSAATYRYPCA